MFEGVLGRVGDCGLGVLLSYGPRLLDVSSPLQSRFVFIIVKLIIVQQAT